MKQIAILSSLAAVLAGLAVAPSASAIKSGGFSLPTKRLESPSRSRFSNGASRTMAAIRHRAPLPRPSPEAPAIKAAVAVNTKHLGRLNQVYVLKQGRGAPTRSAWGCAPWAGSTSLTPGREPSGSKGGVVRRPPESHVGSQGSSSPPGPFTSRRPTRPLVSSRSPRWALPARGRHRHRAAHGRRRHRRLSPLLERLGAQRGWHISVVFFPVRVMARLPPRVTSPCRPSADSASFPRLPHRTGPSTCGPARRRP